MSDVLDTIRTAVPKGVRARSKQALRAYGMASAYRRSLPDFIIIGAKRGGTTSLWRYLEQHPFLAPSFPERARFKGTHFFDTGYDAGMAWYRSHFPSEARRRRIEQRLAAQVVVGEASPYYLYHPCAAERAAAAVPDAKLILVLRNPVDRAYSHYKARVRDSTEPLTFEDALDAEASRLAGEADRIRAEPGYYSFAHEHYSYIEQGLYLEPLQRWLRYYPRRRVLVERSEDLYADPQSVYDRVISFLGLPPFSLLRTEQFNSTPSDPMRATTRAALLQRVRPHNAALEQFLGRQLDWDS
jgi:hypothetical protein